jgi:hypothetical protein
MAVSTELVKHGTKGYRAAVMVDAGNRSHVWIKPLALLGGIAALWLLALFFVDYQLSFHLNKPVWSVLLDATASDITSALGSLPEVVTALLGIVITVVSIILQLSATRYTPRVTEMFFRDRTNLLVMGYFVITAVQCIWVMLLIRRNFVPLVISITTVGMMTCAIFLLIPYFIYVFRFLEPERVVNRLRDLALDHALNRQTHPVAVDERQERVLRGIEQLADVSMNALSQKDRIIASRTIDALAQLAIDYVPQKATLDPAWFRIAGALERNPDFVVMSRESVEDISLACTWVEWKILRQYELIFNESAGKSPELCQLLAINTRYLGECALSHQDRQDLGVVIKFFNTYLRSSINGRDVRTAYNVFHQYRQLAEGVMASHLATETASIAQHFKYYGQIANSAGLSFVTETAAYDLARLCEVAHREGYPYEEQLLQVLLEVDKAPETEAEEKSLRGVRKAQLKLATFYLTAGREDLARRIWQDMEEERPHRLASIRQELLAVRDKDFWEVVDRGHNFDYLDDARKDQLSTFFSWFEKPAQPPDQRP